MDLEKLKKDELIAKIQELEQTEAGQLQAERDVALEKLAAAEAFNAELQEKLAAAEAAAAEAGNKGELEAENAELKVALKDATARLRAVESTENAPVIVTIDGAQYRVKGGIRHEGEVLTREQLKGKPELLKHLVSIGSGLIEKVN